MTESGAKYLSDMMLAIERVVDFLSYVPDFRAYGCDIKPRSAVERQLAIIRDALNNFRRVKRGAVISIGAQIIAFRNRLIYAYDAIGNSIVWMIIKKHHPILKSELSNLKPPQ